MMETVCALIAAKDPHLIYPIMIIDLLCMPYFFEFWLRLIGETWHHRRGDSVGTMP